ncbi:MAG: hypothetical protein ABJD68_07375 [Nakamurella sp.]
MAQRISRLKKGLVIVAAAALTIGGAGAAFAYWTAGGTGDGEATTGNTVDFAFSFGAVDGDLIPGGAGQTVEFTVSNPAEGPQYLTSITVTIADDQGIQWVPPTNCAFSAYHAAVTTAPTPGIIASAGSFNGVVTVTLDNTVLNQDACKGEIVPLHLVAA